MANNTTTLWVVVLVAVLAFFLFVMPFGGGFGGICGMMGSSYSTNYGWGMMGGFGWLFMTLVLVALVLLIVWLVKQLQTPQKK